MGKYGRHGHAGTVVGGFVLAVSLAACGGSADEESPEPDAGGEKLTLRVAHVFPDAHPVNVALEGFSEELAETTDGQLSIDVFPNGELGGDAEVGAAIQAGDVDCGVLNYSTLGLDPVLQMQSLPFIATTIEQADELYYGDGFVAETMRTELQKHGIVAASYFENGFRALTNNVRPIESPADLQGLKIRIPELPLFVDLFEAWGAQPVAMPFPELYTALQQGTVDGQENGIVLSHDSKFQEVQDYLTLLNWNYAHAALACGEAIWGEVESAGYGDAFNEAAENASEEQRELFRAGVDEKLENMKAAGMQVVELDEQQVAEFRVAADAIWEEHVDDFGQEYLDGLRQAIDDAS